MTAQTIPVVFKGFPVVDKGSAFQWKAEQQASMSVTDVAWTENQWADVELVVGYIVHQTHLKCCQEHFT